MVLRIFVSSYYIVLGILFFPLLCSIIHLLFSLKRQLTCAIGHRSKAILWRRKKSISLLFWIHDTILTSLVSSVTALFAKHCCALEMFWRLQLHSNTCHFRKQPPTGASRAIGIIHYSFIHSWKAFFIQSWEFGVCGSHKASK